MDEVILHRKYICFIWAIILVLIGICLHGMQRDSSFVLQNQKKGIQIIKGNDSVCNDAVLLMEETKASDIAYKGNGRMHFNRGLRTAKAYAENEVMIELKHAIEHYLHKIDIRLCRTDNLSSIFTVLYIHHQDGVKMMWEC